MMNVMIILFSAWMFLWCAAAPIEAMPLSGTAVGSWEEVVSTDPGDVYNIANGDEGGVAVFDWGVPSSTPFNSIFTFDGVGSDGEGVWSAPSESPFLVGYFAYTNGSTLNSLGIDGVTLDILLRIQYPLVLARDFLFPFTITNTMNWTGDPVLDGDIVTVTSSFSPEVFSYLGTVYTLELLGFSSNGGVTVRTDFSSPESSTAEAGVYARITSEIPASPVPEPGTLFLLSAGLGGFFLAGRGKRRRIG